MRCRLSPTADVPSHTSGAAKGQERSFIKLFDHALRTYEQGTPPAATLLHCQEG